MFLHFIPAHEYEQTHSGTYKDVVSRQRWLRARFPDYRPVLVVGDDPVQVDQAISAGDRLEGALVEFSYHPRIVQRLKVRAPDACVAVRSINVEPLQHFDDHGWWPRRGPVWMLYGMARLFAHDVAVKRSADVVFSINEWESRVYWNRLPGKARVEWLPYRCPDHLLPTTPTAFERRRVIACMPTSRRNRKSLDLVTRFMALARTMKRLGSSDEFLVTGELSSWGLPPCADVTFTGFLDNPVEFMASCKAIALLSPLGYGIKTTLIDGLAAGAHILAHPGLVRRNPDLVRPLLIPVDSRQERDVRRAIDALRTAPAAGRLHPQLCYKADAVLSRWFGDGESPCARPGGLAQSRRVPIG